MSSNTSQQNTQATHSDDEIDLSQLAGALWFHKWQIATFTAFCTMLGIIYALSTTPIYQADAMLEITSSKNQVLGELSDLLGGSQQTPADTEIELIKSRLVLGKTVNDLGLEVVVKPKISFMDKLSLNKDQVIELEIGKDDFKLGNPLWFNRPFKIVAQGENEYQITTPDETVLSGVVGKPLQLDANSTLLIQKITAPFQQEFTLTRYTQLTSIERIRKNLGVAAKGKNVPILGLSFTGENPEEIQIILSQIIKNYTEHNRNKDVQTATSGLRFIEEELPKLQADLQTAEDRLNQYRAQNNSLDVPTEARGTLESLNKIEMQIVDLKTEESVLSEVYTRDHPAYKALSDKLKVLENAKERLNRQIARMPQTQQSIIRLTRDVETTQAIYVQLLNKRQELKILKASTQGNVRLIDDAITSETPIKPKKKILVLLAMALGAFASMGYYLLKSLLNRGISSEDEIEMLGLNVLCSVPTSETQMKRDRLLKKFSKNKNIRSNTLLSIKDPTDIAVEALRGLRTNLHFSALDAPNKVVMISGATPEVGKSFVSANLAVLMAQSGKKVLLIDGDMRKGYMHHLFDIEAGEGLSEILQDTSSKNYQGRIKATSIEGLEFLSGGSNTPKNPSELLLNNKLPEFLKWAEKHYDHVILDTPPVLAVTDAAVMGQYAGTALLVSRFGQTNPKELEACLSRFTHNKVNINGVILNGIERTAKNYYSYNSYEKYSKNS